MPRLGRAPSFAAALQETVQAALGAAFRGEGQPRGAALIELVKEQRFGEALELLGAQPRLWDVRDEGGHSLLHWASLGGDAGFVHRALTAGVPVDVQARDLQTPLMWAVYGGHAVTVEALLDAGASMTVRDSNDATVLIVAVQQGHHTVAQLLAYRGGDALLSGRDQSGCSAAHWAAHLGDAEALALLDSFNADLQALDDSAMLPLHRAMMGGRVESAEFLLEHWSDPALRSSGGGTCLDIATERGDPGLQKLLLRVALRRLSRRRALTPSPGAPARSISGSLAHVAWAPMEVVMTAGRHGVRPGAADGEFQSGGAAASTEPVEVHRDCGLRSSTFDVEYCDSPDLLLHTVLGRVAGMHASRGDAEVCLWVTDRLGERVNLGGSVPARSCFPLRTRVLCMDTASLREATRRQSAELEIGLTRHLRASPERFLGLVLIRAPQELRWQVWREALELHHRDLPSGGAYREIGLQGNPWSPLITADVHRTFKGYSEEQCQCLFRILNAYAAHNPGVGYCQGMNRVAGLLLLIAGCEREEECFGVLACLMDDIGLAGFYKEGFPLLNRYISACNQVLAEKMPHLIDRLAEEGTEPDMHMRQWFLTLFVDCLPLPAVVGIFDAVLCLGLPVTIRVAAALLEGLTGALVALGNSDITDALKVIRSGGASSGEDLWLGRILLESAGALGTPVSLLLQDGAT